MNIINRTVQVPAYWLAVGLAATLLSPVLSIVASVRIAEGNSKEAADKARTVQLATREEGRLRTCALVGGQVAVYEETPPTTPAGKNAAANWLREYRLNQCQPPK